ncbi:hypothetical protein [Clostridium sp. YIM B02555]|uniref:hypothetical protein n=1 Tax=Clostridium sp. YIM B02555 TaxID=2911968 RepID=UPI001EEE4799|nr:hypothetical protein [Clostridium sp. YIM B02555]
MAKSTTNKKLKDVSIELKKTGPSKKLPKEPIILKLNNSEDIKNSLETICKLILTNQISSKSANVLVKCCRAAIDSISLLENEKIIQTLKVEIEELKESIKNNKW